MGRLPEILWFFREAALCIAALPPITPRQNTVRLKVPQRALRRLSSPVFSAIHRDKLSYSLYSTQSLLC